MKVSSPSVPEACAPATPPACAPPTPPASAPAAADPRDAVTEDWGAAASSSELESIDPGISRYLSIMLLLNRARRGSPLLRPEQANADWRGRSPEPLLGGSFPAGIIIAVAAAEGLGRPSAIIV